MFKKEKDVGKLVLEQIDDVKKCLVLFEGFIKAASVPDTASETLEALCEGLDKAEDVADASLRAMINSLSNGAYLPATRESIIAIATSCDKIANKCEYIANLIVVFGFRFSAEFHDDIEKIYSITIQQFECLTEAIGLLFSKIIKYRLNMKKAVVFDNSGTLIKRYRVIKDVINGKIFTEAKEFYFCGNC
mgnify:CR=1 FL=1